MDDTMGEILTTEKNMRKEMQSNSEVVQGMQSAQKEHKVNMDMLNKQLSHLATSVGEMRGNSGKLLSTVHIPEKAIVSKITLRSGKTYKGPEMKRSVGEPSMKDEEIPTQGREDGRSEKEILKNGREAQVTEQAQIGGKPSEVENERIQLHRRSGYDRTGSVAKPPTGAEKKDSEEVTEILREASKEEKPFPYRFVTKRKEDPVDYMSIFGKLDVTIPFLQAVKLPSLGNSLRSS